MSVTATRIACATLAAALFVLKAQAQQPALSGRDLLKDKGCSQCHTVAGEGGHKGPDLSGVGRRLKPLALEQRILNGGLLMPPFRDALTPEETRLLVAYLHTCRAKTPAK